VKELIVCIYCLSVADPQNVIFTEPTEEIAWLVSFARACKNSAGRIKVEEGECEDCKKDENRVRQKIICRLKP
jgi:hypothetical protein